MMSHTICIWLLLFVLKSECQSLPPQERIPVRLMPQYDAQNNLKFFPAIVGGIPAKSGEFPSMCSIQNRKSGNHICGGTLLDVDYVLTSAHCVSDALGKVVREDTLQIMADDLTIARNGNASRQVVNVYHIFMHPQYDAGTAANDIAILKTSSPFKLTDTLRPSLLSLSLPKEGDACTLAGWGSVSDGSTKPNTMLYKANLTITNTNKCNETYSGLLSKGMFCAKGNRQDACQGDSGGALICGEKGVSGIVSFGNGCDTPGYPGVYIDTSHFSDFIDECMRTPISMPEEKQGDSKSAAHKLTFATFMMMTLSLTMVIYNY